MPLRILAAAFLLSAGFASFVRSEAPDSAAATELVKNVHAAQTEGRLEDAFELFHEEDLRELQALTLELWKLDAELGGSGRFEKMFPGVTREKFAAMTTKEVFLVLANRRKLDPMETAGTVSDGEITYVVVIQKYKPFDLVPVRATETGELRQGLSVRDRLETKTQVRFAQFQRDKIPSSEWGEHMQNSFQPKEAKVLAIVEAPDLLAGGTDLFLVGRGTFLVDGVEEQVVGVTPLNDRHPLRALLDPDDPTNLDDERRAKIEAALMESDRKGRSREEAKP